MARFEEHVRALGMAALGFTMLTGCTFSSPEAAAVCGPASSPNWITCMLDLAPFRAPDSATRKIVYEAPGLIRVLHGRSCLAAPQALSGSGVGFRVQDSASVPLSIADSGAVFMNGWEAHFKNGDHHLQGLGSTISNVTTNRGQDQFMLNWEAGGLISDQNGDDPYEWCYTYSVVFWKRGPGFDAVLSTANGSVLQTTSGDPGDSALREMMGVANNPYGQGVMLPQGFAMMFESTDHHVLQLGFDYGQQHVTGEVGNIRWTSRSLLKDNDRRRGYFAGELFSVLSYSSPQSWHPTYVERETEQGWVNAKNDVALEPHSSSSFCTALGDSTHEEHYRIQNVPFEYAVPVLKGWELGYVCTDHHVRDVGASITDFRYERANDAKTGTLYYTLDLSLADGSENINYGAASVDVFGMNARGLEAHPLNPGGTP